MRRVVVVLVLTIVGIGFGTISPELERYLNTAQASQLLPVHFVLKEQFDTRLLNSLVDGLPRPQRRVETARILRGFSAAKQAALLRYLVGQAGIGSVRDVTPFWIVNVVYCEATPAVIHEVSMMSEVGYANYDLAYAPNLLEPAKPAEPSEEITWGVDKISAPAVWTLGYTGVGIVCGHIDTGCDYTHPDLADHMWTDANYPNHGWNFENNNNDPMDEQGHGTHTAGTVASDGTSGSQCGVAPDAQIMSCRVRTVADSIAESQCWASMQFVVSPPLSPSHGADLYTMSLGWYISWNPQQAIWRTTADNVNAAGLTQCVAAGNERGTNTPPYACRCPGNAPPPWWNPQNTGTGALSGITSIGATDVNDAYASFSSPGPVTWSDVPPFSDYPYPPGLTRPDVAAPGVDTKSCAIGGGYQEMSGTSMATPHTAGTVCLMLSKNPNLLPREVDSILEVTALDLGPSGKDNDYGAGRINALAAVNATRPPFGVRYSSHVVDDSAGGNNDHIVNPGERINLPLRVVNLCDYTAQGISAKLRASDPNIILIDTFKYFGSILQDSTGFTGPDGYEFSVAGACTNRYELKFDLVVTDTLDSVWVTGFSILVGEPVLSGDSTYAYDGGNGKLDPGEECDIAVRLLNTGLGNGYNVSVVLKSGDSRFEVLDSTAVYGLVPADSWVMNTADHFNVRVSASVPREFTIPCTLRVSQTGYPAENIPFGIEVGRLTTIDPIPDGPRAPTLYWAYDNADSMYVEAPQFEWVEIGGIGTPLTMDDDETRTISLPPGFGPFRYYGRDYSQISICSNGFLAPGATTVNDYNNEELPRGTEPAMLAVNWDDLYPPDGGSIWYYHDVANHRFVVQWDSIPYYNNRSVFETNEIVLYDTTMAAWDGNCEFVFQYLTAGQTSEATVGEQDPTYAIGIQALFDGEYHRASAQIVAGRAIKFTTDTIATGIAEQWTPVSGKRFALAPSSNPVSGSVALRYSLPAAARVRLSVFDLSGREVRALVNSGARAVAPGVYSVNWNGADNQGSRLAAGVYFYRLTTSLGELSRKAVLTH